MIFVGDIALPIRNSIKIMSLPSELFQKNWFGNLEGGLVDNSDEKYKITRGVFNYIGAVKDFKSVFNIKGFALANNHIFDVVNIEDTISHLNGLSIQHCGIGLNLDDADKPLYNTPNNSDHRVSLIKND